MNSDWILPEYANPMSVTACGDPAEALARLARLHGCLTLDLIGTQITDLQDGEPTDAAPDQDTLAIFGAMVAHAARAAWRFALVAEDLDRRQELDRQLLQISGAAEPPPPRAEREYMQTLRELAKPWKSEVTGDEV